MMEVIAAAGDGVDLRAEGVVRGLGAEGRRWRDAVRAFEREDLCTEDGLWSVDFAEVRQGELRRLAMMTGVPPGEKRA